MLTRNLGDIIWVAVSKRLRTAGAADRRKLLFSDANTQARVIITITTWCVFADVGIVCVDRMSVDGGKGTAMGTDV